MPAEVPESLRPSLEGVLRAIDERGNSVVVHVETKDGLGQFSVSRSVLRGAAFGDTAGIVALDKLLGAEVTNIEVHEVTDPPPAVDENGEIILDEGPRVADLLDARKASSKGSGFFATMQSAGQDELSQELDRKLVERKKNPSLSDQLSDVPAASFNSTQMAGSESSGWVSHESLKGDSLGSTHMAGSFPSHELRAPNTARDRDDPKTRTAVAGSLSSSALEEVRPARLLSTMTLAQGQLDAPVPSRNFDSEVLEELGDLNRAIESSSKPKLPSEKPEPTQRSDSPMPIVGRYEVLARIRSGAAGSVYLCRHTGTSGFRRLFAMKVLRSSEPNPALVKEFFHEARVLENIHHPNVIGIVDTGTEQEPYLVLDYVEGGSLYDLCQASPLKRDAAVIVTILLDALEGVSAVHESTDEAGNRLDIVHHDLTPHNLLVGLDGACRVADFGVARGGPNAPGQPQYGKPGYIAPERYLGMPGDRRSDVFSLGVVLYTALSGVHPFAADSDEGARQNVLAGKVVPPSTVGVRPPPSLDWICQKALAPAPRERFQSAEDMLVALRKLAAKEDLLASPSAVAEWVKSTMGDQLDSRRDAILRPTVPPPEPTTSEAPPPPMEVMPAGVGKANWSRPPSSYVEKTVAVPSSPVAPELADTAQAPQAESKPKKDRTLHVAVALILVVFGIMYVLPKFVKVSPPPTPNLSEPKPRDGERDVVIPDIKPQER